MTGFLLDTHVWFWVQRQDTEQVKPAFLHKAEDWQRRGVLYASVFSIWEFSMLVSLNRLDLSMPIDRWVEEATVEGGLQLLPLTPRILIECNRLPGDLHRDPADRILAATAREHGLTLVTRDEKLLEYSRAGYLNTLKA